MKSIPISPSEEKKLDHFLQQRPSAKELQEKNILKSTAIAPSLQQATIELEKQQLEDKLANKIAHRPEPEELKQRNILKSSFLYERLTNIV